MHDHDKVTPDLAGVLDQASDDHMLDVVVELAEPEDAPADAPADRAGRIAQMKDSFDAQSTPLEESIASLGGEVVAKAWINRTIHARVPAKAVPELARAGSIAAVDTPHALTPESPA
jgi:hypothetical protein